MIRLRLKKLLRNQLGAGNQSELRERKNGLELVTWVKNCDIRLKNNALVKTSFTRSRNHRISITYHMIHVTGAICIHKCAASIGVLFLISCIQFHFSESSPTVNYTVTWWLLRRNVILLRLEDCQRSNGSVLIPTTIEMARVRRPDTRQYRQNVQFSTNMSEQIVQQTLQNSFPAFNLNEG